MSTDELDRTARYRPHMELRGADDILDRILADCPRTATRSGQRTATLVAVAATVAVAAVLAPALLPTSSPGGATPAAAAELLRLSRAAAASSTETPLRPGQFRQVVITEHQVRPQLDTTLDTWTGSDGRFWRRFVTKHADGTPGRTETYLLTKPDPVTAGFPTDPDELQRYLTAHATGSTSTDEAVFSQLADLLRGPTVPAALRSAATQVLARTGHVQLGPRTTDSYGRTVQEVRFVDEANRPGQVQAIVFDTADARSTAERITVADPQTSSPYYQEAVAPAVITNEVPADVLRDAVPYGTGADTDPSHGG